MNRQRKNILVICGPTASGKTHLGIELAQALNGEIISADSRQVYRTMDIGAGKDIAEFTTTKGAVLYHLIDIVDPDRIYTLYHYQRDCYLAIEDIQNRCRLPIIVGGTGLYIEAVLKHYKTPNVPEDVSLRKKLTERDKDDLLKELFNLDPVLFARTDRSSKKRVVRAVEIALFSQKTPVEWGHPNPPTLHPLVLCVRWDRKELRHRITERLRNRLDEGMIEEAQRILASGIDRDRYEMFGLEYKYAGKFIDGELTREQMFHQLEIAIHQFAKRQETYFRGMARRGIAIQYIPKADFKRAMQIISHFMFT